MLLKIDGKQQNIIYEIMKYKELLDEGIITEGEFFIKEEDLLEEQ